MQKDEKQKCPTKLQKVRVYRNISQKKLSQISGINVRTIQCYEQKSHDIDGAKLDTLLNLCLALECHLVDLIENKELAEKLKCVEAKFSNSCISDDIKDMDLNSKLYITDEYEIEKSLYSKFFNNDNLSELSNDQKDGIQYVLQNFPEYWRQILRLRYYDNMTLAEISNVTGVTRERVRQIIVKGIERLKKLEKSEYVIYGLNSFREKVKQEEKNCSIFEKSINYLNLSGRAYNCLMRANIQTIGYVLLFQNNLSKIPNIGKTTVDEILSKLNKYIEKYISSIY